MLKPISRLRSICKGDLNIISSYSNVIIHNRIRKNILHSIPVLSIFVLLGIVGYNVGLFNTKLGFGIPLVEPDGSVYAAESTSNTSSLIIDNGELKNDSTTTGGGTVYSSHIVQVKAGNIDSYSLTITGPTSLSGSTAISGANNKTGSTLADNTWGYAWDNTNVADENMTYASFTGGNQPITKTTATSGAINNPSISNYQVDFTRKLVFAAKFGSDAKTGHYKANVKLNLTITPKEVAFNGITKMQDMTADICKSASGSGELYDTRDGTIYTVRKLADGNCWMTDNLKLDLSTTTLTKNDSDVSSTYAAGTATNADSTWSNTNTVAQFSTNGKGSSSYKTDYGYYYSWCAATAGTCSSATTANAEASSSICPKGWKLPKGGSSGDFQTLYSKYTPASGWSTVNSINGKWLGASAAGSGGAFFPAAGDVNSSGLGSAGSNGYYWSRTVYNSYRAYSLGFNSGYVDPANDGYNKYCGYSVRCVAYSS